MVAGASDPDFDQAEQESRARRMIACRGLDCDDARIESRNSQRSMR
jgi:hypothetical protein